MSRDSGPCLCGDPACGRCFPQYKEPKPTQVLTIGTEVVSTWSPSVRGTIVGYGFVNMDGRPFTDGSLGGIKDDVKNVYLIDLGRSRVFDIIQELPGPFAARILCLQFDRVIEVTD